MQRHPDLYFAASEVHGRGVFAAGEIPATCLLEICPVLLIPAEQKDIIHKTALHDFYFLWGKNHEAAAIVLGFGSLYNHSFTPNAEFIIDYENETVDFYSLEIIKPGDEVTFNYNGNDDFTPVWFQKDEKI